MSASDGIAYELTRVSGAHAGDCCFVGQRYEERDGCFRPGRGESYVCTVTAERTRLEIGGLDWITGIWRAPDRTIYACDAAGRMYTLPRGEGDRWSITEMPGPLIGVWGLDEANVWTWGSAAGRSAIYRFDGGRWIDVPSPGEVVALHGLDPSFILAVGHRGLIARWTGREWRTMETPVHESLNGVAALSPDEAYAITPSGVFLEGSAYGWVVSARREHLLYSVGTFRGRAYVSGPWPDGLLRRDGASLTTVHREIDAYQMDTRAELLVVTPHAIRSSPDGEVWRGFGVNVFEALVEHRPAPWRR